MKGHVFALPVLAAVLSSHGCAYFGGDYHMVRTKGPRVRGTFSRVFTEPNLTVLEWDVFMARPPDLPGQTDVSYEVQVVGIDKPEAKEVYDAGQRRPMVELIVASGDKRLQSRLETKFIFEATLMTQNLVPGPPARPAEELSGPERSACLAESWAMDFNDREFQRWLDEKGLRRGKESDLRFAYRAFETLARDFSYFADPKGFEQRASRVCRLERAECGGLSHLFVAILRASGIPARILVGWAVGDGTHVKAEFYAEKTGWVPVEVSGGVSTKDTSVGTHFGGDPYPLLVAHVNDNIEVETARFGRHNLGWMLNYAYWMMGGGGGGGGGVAATNRVELLSGSPGEGRK